MNGIEEKIVKASYDRLCFRLGEEITRKSMLIQTAEQRKSIRELDSKRRELFQKFLNGKLSAKSFRNQIKEVIQQRTALLNEVRKQSKPYREVINPLKKVQRGLDELLIALHTERGAKPEPKTKVPPEYQHLLRPKKKSRKSKK